VAAIEDFRETVVPFLGTPKVLEKDPFGVEVYFLGPLKRAMLS
jgi:hypothetical protein